MPMRGEKDQYSLILKAITLKSSFIISSDEDIDTLRLTSGVALI
jgi:hypothetical protein